jgi:ligand-binding SRPBCC domain-containing protein
LDVVSGGQRVSNSPQCQPVTFTAVAARTGLGRSTLYRDPTIRAVIEEHRHRTATSGTVTGLTDEIAWQSPQTVETRLS